MAKRRVALVVSILMGETSVAEAARQHSLTVAEVEEHHEKFLLGVKGTIYTGTESVYRSVLSQSQRRVSLAAYVSDD